MTARLYTPNGVRAEGTWSTRLELPPLHREQILQKLSDSVLRIAQRPDVERPELYPISGYIEGSGDNPDRTAVVLARDPSRSFGTPSPERCDEIAAEVATMHGWQRTADEVATGGFRVILGRRRGYGEDAYLHPMEEIRDLTSGSGLVVGTEVDLFSARYIDGTVSQYDEPGVVVTGKVDALADMEQLAYDLGQERYVPEIFGVETLVMVQSPSSQR